MKMALRSRLCLVAFVILYAMIPSVTFAQSKSADESKTAAESVSESETTETVEAVEAAPAPKPAPKYMNLRYDDDFSYLDGPEGSFEPDLFDPIKWMHITDDLTLSLGGEVRAQLDSETNRAFGSVEPAQDTYFLHRYFMHADLRYRKLARIFLQGVSAHIEDRDLALLPIHENRFDFHQLFLDYRFLGEEVPLTVRVGRQELQYGKQRLVSPLDWGNTRRRFDGVKVFYQGEAIDVDVWYTKPVINDLSEGLNRKPDEYRPEQDFYGLYTTYKGIKDHVIEAYFLGLIDDGDLRNVNGRFGDLSLYTIGGRFGGTTGNWDYDAEMAGQWGKFAGDTVQAWMAGTEAGYTFKSAEWKPRVGAGFDWGSGDKDPTDNVHQTFNQLFPLGHAYLGYLDLFARQNVLASNINVTAKPHEKVTLRAAWMTFWNDSKRDAIYNAGGGASRRVGRNIAGHDIGNELDLTVQYAIDRHQSLLLGYSHFWGTNFIRATGPSRDADLLYVQYAFKF